MYNNNSKNPAEEAVEQFFTSEPDNQTVEKTDIGRNVTIKTQKPSRKMTKFNENDRELKQKRKNFVILPSVFEKIEKIAYVDNISVNEAINRALVLYCKKFEKKIGLYAKIEEMKANNDSEKEKPE